MEERLNSRQPDRAPTFGEQFRLKLEEGNSPDRAVATAVITRRALLAFFRYSDDANEDLHDRLGVVQGTVWKLVIQWAVSRVRPGLGPVIFDGVVSVPCVLLDESEERLARIVLTFTGKGAKKKDLHCEVSFKPGPDETEQVVMEFRSRLVPVETVLARKK